MESRKESFLKLYFAYTERTESPRLFHRWAAYSGIAALLGRKFYLPHGHFSVYPNMYVMLMGNPGTRKSTTIKLMKHLLKEVGYETIAANRTSKEKFLLDLHEGINSDTFGTLDPTSGTDQFLDTDFREQSQHNEGPSEVFIMADELNVFIGRGNLEFIDMLGDLWDYDGVYHGRVKNSKSVLIHDPTINMLAGNTPSGFAKAFPPEIIEQGFLSRILMIHGKPNGEKIPFPTQPRREETFELLKHLTEIWKGIYGPATMTDEARSALGEVYTSWTPIQDARFEYYSTRRFTHLLKLCLVVAASRISKEITIEDVVEANTVLTFTESLMPMALGEFGKSKSSDIANKVMDIMHAATAPVTMQELWKALSSDVEKTADLGVILQNLTKAEKIQQIKGASGAGGWLPRKVSIMNTKPKFVDFSLITDQEKLNV